MNCKFLKVYCVTITDGYTDRPVAYFSTRDQATYFLQKVPDSAWHRISDKTYDAIQIDDKVYLLGKLIDLDQNEKKKREALINSAKNKLSAEELAALLNK